MFVWKDTELIAEFVDHALMEGAKKIDFLGDMSPIRGGGRPPPACRLFQTKFKVEGGGLELRGVEQKRESSKKCSGHGPPSPIQY